MGEAYKNRQYPPKGYSRNGNSTPTPYSQNGNSVDEGYSQNGNSALNPSSQIGNRVTGELDQPVDADRYRKPGAATFMGFRRCRVTGVDISTQHNEVDYLDKKTALALAQHHPPAFAVCLSDSYRGKTSKRRMSAEPVPAHR